MPDRQPVRQPTDAELLASLSGNAAETFWCLWNRYQGTLHQVCLREMDGHAADAEDALSQVMLKTLDRLPAYALEIRHLKAWLLQMTRNLCLDLRRKQQHQSETAENWKIITLTEPQNEPPMVYAERDSEILLRIATLPPRLREPLELYIVQEIPVKQVAAQLGLSPANVRKRVQLARAQLRRQMDGHPATNSAGKKPRRSVAGNAAPGPSAELGECRPVVIGTVRVKLSCGMEDLFHVFSSQIPFAPGRTLRSLQSQLLRDPENHQMRLRLGDLFHNNGQWLTAVGEWQRALAVRPHLPTALKLGRVLLKLGQPDQAALALERFRQEKFLSAAAGRHFDGWIAYCQMDARQSAMEFQAGADLDPENPVHWHGLAMAHQLAGRTPEALAAIQHAMKLNQNDLVALSLGHEILVAAGDLAEAIRRAQYLLNLAPRDLLTICRLLKCRCRLNLAADRETKQLLRRAMRLSQNPFLMHETLAAFFRSQCELQKALAAQRKSKERRMFHDGVPG